MKNVHVAFYFDEFMEPFLLRTRTLTHTHSHSRTCGRAWDCFMTKRWIRCATEWGVAVIHRGGRARTLFQKLNKKSKKTKIVRCMKLIVATRKLLIYICIQRTRYDRETKERVYRTYLCTFDVRMLCCSCSLYLCSHILAFSMVESTVFHFDAALFSAVRFVNQPTAAGWLRSTFFHSFRGERKYSLRYFTNERWPLNAGHTKYSHSWSLQTTRFTLSHLLSC